MTNPLDEPLPLVTATFTTEELAGMSAGLILLKRNLVEVLAEQRRGLPGTAARVARTELALSDAHATSLKVSALVSQEQGQSLLRKLFKSEG